MSEVPHICHLARWRLGTIDADSIDDRKPLLLIGGWASQRRIKCIGLIHPSANAVDGCREHPGNRQCTVCPLYLPWLGNHTQAYRSSGLATTSTLPPRPPAAAHRQLQMSGAPTSDTPGTSRDRPSELQTERRLARVRIGAGWAQAATRQPGGTDDQPVAAVRPGAAFTWAST